MPIHMHILRTFFSAQFLATIEPLEVLFSV